MTSSLDSRVLALVQELQAVEDSYILADKLGVRHEMLVGVLKSLEMDGLLSCAVRSEDTVVLTDEGESYVQKGSPEMQVFKAVSAEGSTIEQLQGIVGNADLVKFGVAAALRNKFLRMEKRETGNMLLHNVESPRDATREDLVLIKAGQPSSVDKKELDGYKKRKLCQPFVRKFFSVQKGPHFALERKKAAVDLTPELISSGAWKQTDFKDYNFEAEGKPTDGGYLHPLLKVRSEFREIFLEMGFEEMPTNNFVESSFWNFDALFQPQQHPARDAHDTFFLSDPARAPVIPEAYMQVVKKTHESGGFGSVGYCYDWKEEEARKNILRTHTTAVSTRMLKKLAESMQTTGEFVPKKYFSIDRVFRNEMMDATHLCEFHQVEGMVIDRHLSLGNLIGVIKEFFAKIGIRDVRFKPAYNPYTEPSMEIFGFHPQLNRWVEIGNSGMFRPEMLRPMGIAEDVRVVAWGLSLERPTMILYSVNNIRDLMGHKVDLQGVRRSPICRIQETGS